MILQSQANFQSCEIAQAFTEEKWRAFPAEVQLFNGYRSADPLRTPHVIDLSCSFPRFVNLLVISAPY
jgi:hypothetical protein